MGTVHMKGLRHKGIHDAAICLRSLIHILAPRPPKTETCIIKISQKSAVSTMSIQVKYYIPDLPKEYFQLPGSQDTKQALHSLHYIYIYMSIRQNFRNCS